MKKPITISIIIAVLLIGGVLVLGGNKTVVNETESASVPANNVSVVDGVQIIDITARGGYMPRKSVAKAGMPTIIRFNTKGTFDCSSSVRIPSMKITKNLPQSGSTDIDVGNQEVGLLLGTCGMGMYPFEVEFRG
jgi:plastocyanin domain-containing protein